MPDVRDFFTLYTQPNSIASGIRKCLSIWESFAKYMLNDFSVRKFADIFGIYRNTAFAWRHKLLDALQQLAEKPVWTTLSRQMIPFSVSHIKATIRKVHLK